MAPSSKQPYYFDWSSPEEDGISAYADWSANDRAADLLYSVPIAPLFPLDSRSLETRMQEMNLRRVPGVLAQDVASVQEPEPRDTSHPPFPKSLRVSNDRLPEQPGKQQAARISVVQSESAPGQGGMPSPAPRSKQASPRIDPQQPLSEQDSEPLKHTLPPQQPRQQAPVARSETVPPGPRLPAGQRSTMDVRPGDKQLPGQDRVVLKQQSRPKEPKAGPAAAPIVQAEGVRSTTAKSSRQTGTALDQGERPGDKQLPGQDRVVLKQQSRPKEPKAGPAAAPIVQAEGVRSATAKPSRRTGNALNVEIHTGPAAPKPGPTASTTATRSGQTGKALDLVLQKGPQPPRIRRPEPTTPAVPPLDDPPQHPYDLIEKLKRKQESRGFRSLRVEELSVEQRTIHEVVMSRKNTFFTGAAGTGKSVVTRTIIASFCEILNKDQIVILAPTGVAASHIGGTTIHHFTGLRPNETYKTALKRLQGQQTGVASLWRTVQVIIIDEVSMVDPICFTGLDLIARGMRDPSRPFGGIQMVVCGDFYQIPPVHPKGAEPDFAFEAPCWGQTFQHCFKLVQVWRQRDPDFIDILNHIRTGNITDEISAKISAIGRRRAPGRGSVRLCALRKRAEEYNNDVLFHRRGVAHIFPAVDYPEASTDWRAGPALHQCMAPEVLLLKVGAPVMLVQNEWDEGKLSLVNGSCGVVIGFSTKDDWEARSKDLTIPLPWDHNPTTQWTPTWDQKRNQWIAETTKMTRPAFPVVAFEDRSQGEVVVVQRLVTPAVSQEFFQGLRAERIQIPLLLGWALTIHKSQGLTLPAVEIDLLQGWGHGMAYVVFSRVTSKEGLILIHPFQKSWVQVNRKVVAFDDGLQIIVS